MMPESPDLFEVLWELVLRTFYDAFCKYFRCKGNNFFLLIFIRRTDVSRVIR